MGVKFEDMDILDAFGKITAPSLKNASHKDAPER